MYKYQYYSVSILKSLLLGAIVHVVGSYVVGTASTKRTGPTLTARTIPCPSFIKKHCEYPILKRRASFISLQASIVSTTETDDNIKEDEVQQQQLQQQSTTSESTTTQTKTIRIALTRELGMNTKLQKAIQKSIGSNDNNKIELLELPCIEHATGPDYDKLSILLQTEQWDYIVITSPEAARVLISAWPTTTKRTTTTTVEDSVSAIQSTVPIVVAVGIATEQVLSDGGIAVGFVPSKATAKTLVAELPIISSNNKLSHCTVLYPASARAEQTIQNGLESRVCSTDTTCTTFKVTRLNTYDTVPSIWSESVRQDIIKQNDSTTSTAAIDIVTFASPSSIKGWMINTGNNTSVKAACIGETSATACEIKYGWNTNDIFYPNKPGIDGWVNAIQNAISSL